MLGGKYIAYSTVGSNRIKIVRLNDYKVVREIMNVVYPYYVISYPRVVADGLRVLWGSRTSIRISGFEWPLDYF